MVKASSSNCCRKLSSIFIFGLSLSCASFFTTTTMVVSAAPLKVMVTGAGGQTGQLLFKKLLTYPNNEFEPIGVVRTDESKAKLVSLGFAPESSIVVADVTDSDSIEKAVKSMSPPIDALCICTSATPAPTGEMDATTGRPIFGYPNGQPEVVDWIGQKNQIDAVLKCNKDAHVVICSSMGGTNPENNLNALGRTTKEDGSVEGGNILLWKRKAEVYLKDSGLPYTIIHPGGLINEPGNERELVLGVDDEKPETTESRTVPREDVAEVMLQALRYKGAYSGRSFDLRAKSLEEGGNTCTDFVALLNTLNGRNCDYSLGKIA